MSTHRFPAMSLEQVVNRILSSRQITHEDQHLLLLCRTLTPQEEVLIDRVFDRLHRGLLKVVD